MRNVTIATASPDRNEGVLTSDKFCNRGMSAVDTARWCQADVTTMVIRCSQTRLC
jgi:hypothetical protein